MISDEDLELLKKDFFGRVNYEVHMLTGKIEKPFFMDGDTYFTLNSKEILEISDYKPLLYPKSQWKEDIAIRGEWFCPQDVLNKIISEGDLRIDSDFDLDVVDVSYIDVCYIPVILDKLNEWMIDYRGLIDKGLAIDVTEGLGDIPNPYSKT